MHATSQQTHNIATMALGRGRRRRVTIPRTAIVACVSLASLLDSTIAWTNHISAHKRRAPLSATRLFSATNNDDSSSPTENNKNIKRKRPSAADFWQRKEMANHEILTRQQDLEFGNKIVRANSLRASMAALIERKTSALEQEILYQVYSDYSQELNARNQEDLDDLEHLSVIRPDDEDELMFDSQGMPTLSGDEYSLNNHFQNHQEGRIMGIDDLDDSFLSENEIVTDLGVEGGRAELQQILLEGAFARDQLIRNNVRLVISIAKRWARQSAKYNNQDGALLVSIYAGNAFTPSLDEAIQEGILGLVRAADRYDPSRGLRFSTYCTYWVTNFVRNCFTNAATGTIRVPEALSVIKSKYNAIIKQYYAKQEEIPPEEVIAEEIGCSVNRLRTAIRATQRLLSIDEPLMGPRKGSSAGGEMMGESVLLISDTITCTEDRPEDQVELSFLRQSLENAMASELSPHERDVLRLRLGLDDGVSRTVREVAEVCGGNLSMSEVRLAEQRAYRKLRAPYSVANYQLMAFLDFAGVDRSSMKRF